MALLSANGLVDHIVDERHDASLEPGEFCERMTRTIEYELASVAAVPVRQLVAPAGTKVPQSRRNGL